MLGLHGYLFNITPEIELHFILNTYKIGSCL